MKRRLEEWLFPPFTRDITINPGSYFSFFKFNHTNFLKILSDRQTIEILNRDCFFINSHFLLLTQLAFQPNLKLFTLMNQQSSRQTFNYLTGKQLIKEGNRNYLPVGNDCLLLKLAHLVWRDWQDVV